MPVSSLRVNGTGLVPAGIVVVAAFAVVVSLFIVSFSGRGQSSCHFKASNAPRSVNAKCPAKVTKQFRALGSSRCQHGQGVLRGNVIAGKGVDQFGYFGLPPVSFVLICRRWNAQHMLSVERYAQVVNNFFHQAGQAVHMLGNRQHSGRRSKPDRTLP